ncbi:MAG: HAD-IA family hydrolase [Burkholderiaceae bacterium]
MMQLSQRRCVLFDVDGTIAETEGHAHLPAFNRAFEQVGLAWHWSRDDYHGLLKTAGGFERLVRHAEDLGQDPQAMREQLTLVHQAKNKHYGHIMAAGAVPPRQGFADLVRALHAKDICWGVVTTTSRANWDALWRYSLQPLNLPEPRVIVCGEDVATKKPDPQAYLIALERLGLVAAEACAIEDSRNGLLAAKGAGLDVAIVASEFFGDEQFAEAQQVVDELSELLVNI